MAIYDTYKPFVIGNQFVPIVEQPTILDTGSEIGYRFVATEDFYSTVNGLTWVRAITNSPPPGSPNRSEIVCRVYHGEPLETCTPIQKLVIPCTAGSGGSIGGGAASRQVAVANPSDLTYVRLSGASQTARFWFGTDAATVAAAFSGWYVEIVDVSILYTVSGPFGTATTNTMSLGMERQAGPVKRYMDYLVTGPAVASSATEIKRSRFGELCPFWDVGTNPNTEPARGPWVYRGDSDIGLYALSGSGTDDIAVFFETGATAAGDFDIQYVGLQISYRENLHLIGVGGMDLSAGVQVAEGLYSYRCPVMQSDLPWEVTSGGAISVITLNEAESYSVVMSRAYSGSVSVASPVSLPISLINTIDQNVTNLTGIKITKPTAEGAVPVYEETTEFPAIVLFDVSPILWSTEMNPAHVNPAGHCYEKRMPQLIHDAGYFYAEQQILDDIAGSFAWAIFYARASESVTGGLYLSQTDGAGTFLGPQGYITYEEWYALPEITGGWRKVILPISPSAVLAGSGGVTHWRFWTSSGELLVWEVLGATANYTVTATGASSGAVSGYHGESAIASFRGSSNYPLDLTLMLTQEMTPVSMTVTQRLQALENVDEFCAAAVGSIPTGIIYNHLEWQQVTTGMVNGWGYYEIQRCDDTMVPDVWEVIAKITTPFIAEMDDYEALVGVESTYRIRTVHTTGVESEWSAEVSSTILAPGVTGQDCDSGLLVMTSNANPTSNLAYVHVHGQGDEEGFEFVEASQQRLDPVFRRDYQIALRPTERGGVTFSRTLLVNAAGIPSGSLDKGFTGLRDLAWDAIPYVCVRDELANRWLANINVPSGAVRRHNRRATHYQVAQVTITEVTDIPQPLDIAEPYLGLTSSLRQEYAAWASPVTGFGTLDDLDIAMKIIVRDISWNVYAYRYFVGPPETMWGFAASSYDGGTMNMYVLGDDGNIVEYADLAIVPNQSTWIRCVYDHDNGSGKSTAFFYTSLDGNNWTRVAEMTGGPAGLVPTVNGTFYISPNKSVVVEEAIITNVTTGVTIMHPVFSDNPPLTDFTDAYGVQWNILGW